MNFDISENQLMIEQMVKDLKTSGEIGDSKDYSGGFAERFSK